MNISIKKIKVEKNLSVPLLLDVEICEGFDSQQNNEKKARRIYIFQPLDPSYSVFSRLVMTEFSKL